MIEALKLLGARLKRGAKWKEQRMGKERETSSSK
jgi:hypothetical protein